MHLDEQLEIFWGKPHQFLLQNAKYLLRDLINRIQSSSIIRHLIVNFVIAYFGLYESHLLIKHKIKHSVVLVKAEGFISLV